MVGYSRCSAVVSDCHPIAHTPLPETLRAFQEVAAEKAVEPVEPVEPVGSPRNRFLRGKHCTRFRARHHHSLHHHGKCTYCHKERWMRWLWHEPAIGASCRAVSNAFRARGGCRLAGDVREEERATDKAAHSVGVVLFLLCQ